jgi:hypothetical protein
MKERICGMSEGVAGRRFRAVCMSFLIFSCLLVFVTDGGAGRG